ncbi:AraC family transcriptional regulator [Mucilaginibacter sp. L3T2-6]|uniref:helix-turn-helix domain-containing protein n=1 Tax=Mucilaginibacter sp. L3T2-6 TaxID=3062491 RepID=UPI00267479A2|nr:helix-turn-helix domain-containing protein [Mucilaginibacter sp. L3T2-6]MDO3643856.1 helix-turn-helix domain-containing protein [Mucilaginibacter sp. L3T2-6]MDV6216421.1 helix-turn-helix domain-containing protein [Mucilaginibacter sp. L3T2-6]
MEKKKAGIPYYTEINDFLASIPWPARTDDPDFYCLRLEQLDQDVQVYRPPFKRSFYFFALLINSGNIEVSYGDHTINNPDSYLVFHSPNLVYSFSHNNALKGYVVYFKPGCFSFFKPDFHQQFPLFDRLHTNLFKFDRSTFEQLTPHFEAVFTAYERSARAQHIEARLKLLGLLYHLHDFDLQRNISPVNPQQSLLRRFIQLIDNHYIDKRTVQEYADMLSVSANYLSQCVKQVSGKNALTFITGRLANEARALIQYTDLEIAQIAYQLNFSDPANFGKFFKKQIGLSPSEFRRARR